MAIVSLDWNALVTERDALRAEVERMRAVVEAAREFMSVCEDWVACGTWESYVALRRALSALDAAKEGT